MPNILIELQRLTATAFASLTAFDV